MSTPTTSTTLTEASRQWASRPADERYTSLLALQQHTHAIRDHSRAVVVPSTSLRAVPTDANHQRLAVVGVNGHPYAPTHWSFGQLASLAGAPAGYLRTLPAELSADLITYGLQIAREAEEVGVLLTRAGDEPVLRAATGPPLRPRVER